MARFSAFTAIVHRTCSISQRALSVLLRVAAVGLTFSIAAGVVLEQSVDDRSRNYNRLIGSKPALADGFEELIVNSDSGDPAVPLDLSLTVRVASADRVLSVRARIGKHPAYPSALFFDKDVNVEIQLPPGLQLLEGKPSWRGDLKGDEIAEFEVKLKPLHDFEGIVSASATGRAAGGRVDADTEQFYVFVKGNVIRIGLDPFRKEPHKPGDARPQQGEQSR